MNQHQLNRQMTELWLKNPEEFSCTIMSFVGCILQMDKDKSLLNQNKDIQDLLFGVSLLVKAQLETEDLKYIAVVANRFFTMTNDLLKQQWDEVTAISHFIIAAMEVPHEIADVIAEKLSPLLLKQFPYLGESKTIH